MTTGQMMFYAGTGLLGVTVLLAIVFAIKKPKYQPQNTAAAATAPLTAPMSAAGAAAPAEQATEFMAPQAETGATEFMDAASSRPTELMGAAETEYLRT